MVSYVLQFPSDRLFGHMLRILDDASRRYGRPFTWTFGGGTVLALRHQHRFSKDIDVFVPDPQYLGYLTPRLSDVAAEGEPDYEEGAEFVKIRYPEGEVDFVVGGLLTDPGTELALVQGIPVKLETDIEIIAKKLHFRGDRFKARDLFDLAMLIERSPEHLTELSPWTQRHRQSLIHQLTNHLENLRPSFDAIDSRGYKPQLELATTLAIQFLAASTSPKAQTPQSPA
jgi:hypothetical protein